MTPAKRLAPWMILVMILTGVVVCVVGWLAMRDAAKPGPPPTALPPPTAATRTMERLPADPVESFERIARRGMSSIQLQGMIDEFQKSGLDGRDPDLDPELLAWRQKRWYLEALSLALNLDENQRLVAQKALLTLPDRPDDSGFPMSPRSANCPVWLAGEATAPWRLCELTPRQLGLTGQAAWKKQLDGEPAALPEESGALAIDGSQPLPRELQFLLPSAPVKIAANAGSGTEAMFESLHPAQAAVLMLIEGVPPELLQGGR